MGMEIQEVSAPLVAKVESPTSKTSAAKPIPITSRAFKISFLKGADTSCISICTKELTLCPNLTFPTKQRLPVVTQIFIPEWLWGWGSCGGVFWIPQHQVPL